MLSLALWEPDDEARNRTVHMLAQLGFHVHSCRDAAGLFQWLDLRDADLVLVGESAPLSQVVETVLPRLSTRYGAGILVQTPNAGQEIRLNALRAGAHMCLDRSYEATELAALLRAQARRALRQRRRVTVPRQATHSLAANSLASTVGLVGSADMAGLLKSIPAVGVHTYAPQQVRAFADPAAMLSRAPVPTRQVSIRDPWRVLYQGWVLVTPLGKHIHLTGTERICFACLLENPKRELSRAAMQQFMSAANLRSVNVAISRLRKKVCDTGERLPLHTVHGMGYVFVGELASQE